MYNNAPKFTPLTAIICALLVIAGIAALLTFGSYDERETLTGELIWTPPTEIVRAPVEGRLTTIYQSKDSPFEEGTLLAKLEHSASEMQRTDQLIRELQDRESDLRAQMTQAQALEEQLEFDAVLASMKKLQGILSEEIELQSKRLALSQASAEQPSTGRQEDEILLRQLDVLRSRAKLTELEHSILKREQSLSETKAANQEAMADLNQQLQDVKTEIDHLQSQSQPQFLAQRRGRILDAFASPGDQVQEGQPLLSFQQETASLMARSVVTISQAARLKVDQSAYLDYQAFPQQRYGLQVGRISQIKRFFSPTAETEALSPANQEGFMEVLIDLPSQTISQGGQSFRLREGMQVSIAISVNRRPLYSWLFGSIFDGGA